MAIAILSQAVRVCLSAAKASNFRAWPRKIPNMTGDMGMEREFEFVGKWKGKMGLKTQSYPSVEMDLKGAGRLRRARQRTANGFEATD